MRPVTFPGVNCTYGDNQPEYQPLPCIRFEDGMTISCWELSPEEAQRVSTNRRIYLQQLTFNKPLQPILPAADLDDCIVPNSKPIEGEPKQYHDMRMFVDSEYNQTYICIDTLIEHLEKNRDKMNEVQPEHVTIERFKALLRTFDKFAKQ